MPPRDTRDRVRAGILNSGLPWPSAQMTIPLVPAAPPRLGPAADLAITVAILAANRGKIIIGTKFDSVTHRHDRHLRYRHRQHQRQRHLLQHQGLGHRVRRHLQPDHHVTIVRGPGNSGF